MKNLQIFDNGGSQYFDRYTVIIDNDVYGMSNNPLSPQGFNQYYCDKSDLPNDLKHLGKNITNKYLSLPHNVFVAINKRMEKNRKCKAIN